MQAFDIKRMTLDKFPLEYLGEVTFRCFFIFVVVFIFLKLTGRRGVNQLSLFEVVIILTLGSAAGDVTFYDDVPLLPVFAVFFSILLLYRLSTWLMDKSRHFQNWMEGKPLIIIRDGMFEWETMARENITKGEFYMELRQKGVEHLGQVRLAFLEANGGLSVYFRQDGDVEPGLPVLPEDYIDIETLMMTSGLYACHRCSLIKSFKVGEKASCPRCQNINWVRALSTVRV
ncbi:DUF421 domain-containing protein (plasmid) [Rahnella variigena]|uniref:DUF421 domain-containing protein n=1 Tax=Rahnella TaxID=34037 RepID=UPI000DD37FE7|nr:MULTISPECIES: YetF domain-containing protein [Rahnella]MDH2898845.1 DUF421 domain-containing protein [Rahnella variigena]